MTWETFFLKNHTQNVVKKLFPDSFLKNQNWAYLWIDSLKSLCQVESCRNTLKLSCRPLAFTSFKVFWKNKKTSRTNLFLPHFLHDFWKKMLLLLYSINWQSLIVWLSLLRKILGNMCIVIVFYPGCDVINFEINLISLIKPFFCMNNKSKQKFTYLKNKKRF